MLLVGWLVWCQSTLPGKDAVHRSETKDRLSQSVRNNSPVPKVAGAKSEIAGGNAFSSSLPPIGAPLKPVLSELKSRANAGERAAASRLYRDLQICARAQYLNRVASAAANRLIKASSTEVGHSEESGSSKIQRSYDFVNDNRVLCDGIDAADAAQLVPATLLAAKLGDSQAADCYVFANLNSWFNFGLKDNPEWIIDYNENALEIARGAVQRGDWTMVNLLGWAYHGGFSSQDMLSQLTGVDPIQAYTYLKLLTLGRPTKMGGSAVTIRYMTDVAAQMKLGAADVEAANARAQDMYQRYFNSTPRMNNADALQACQMDMR